MEDVEEVTKRQESAVKSADDLIPPSGREQRRQSRKQNRFDKFGNKRK